MSKQRDSTTKKGDVGVAFVAADLISKNFIVSLPMSEHSPFDLIITYNNTRHFSVQVKYITLVRGRIEIRLASVWSNKQGVHVNKMDKSKIDIVAVYCPTTNKCYYLRPMDISGSTLTLRVTLSPAVRLDKANLADDYCDILKVLPVV
jgi:hypothetical protein